MERFCFFKIFRSVKCWKLPES